MQILCRKALEIAIELVGLPVRYLEAGPGKLFRQNDVLSRLGRIEHELQAAEDHVVADQECEPFAVSHMHRRHATPHLAAVDDVVVHERGLVEQLDRRRKPCLAPVRQSR